MKCQEIKKEILKLGVRHYLENIFALDKKEISSKL